MSKNIGGNRFRHFIFPVSLKCIKTSAKLGLNFSKMCKVVACAAALFKMVAVAPPSGPEGHKAS